MDLLKIGTQLVMQKLNLNVGSDIVQSALSSLLGGGSSGGGLDIMGLVSKMQGDSGLSSLVGSFLGDGDNESMSADNILSVLGGDKVGEFASKVGVSQDDAASGLSDVIPSLIDQASSGGNLLEAAGGIGGLLNKAKSFF